MFHCKACEAKDKHIADLSKALDKERSLLEKVVAPAHTYQPAVAAQANIALDGAGTLVDAEQPELDETQKHLSAVEKQALSLLTGTY